MTEGCKKIRRVLPSVVNMTLVTEVIRFLPWRHLVPRAGEESESELATRQEGALNTWVGAAVRAAWASLVPRLVQQFGCLKKDTELILIPAGWLTPCRGRHSAHPHANVALAVMLPVCQVCLPCAWQPTTATPPSCLPRPPGAAAGRPASPLVCSEGSYRWLGTSRLHAHTRAHTHNRWVGQLKRTRMENICDQKHSQSPKMQKSDFLIEFPLRPTPVHKGQSPAGFSVLSNRRENPAGLPPSRPALEAMLLNIQCFDDN